jgi:MoaA/NifB/PqqE/SkfB family radical SAM enzyme
MDAGREKYFFLKSDCFLITGAVNAAIYQLCSGDVYSIDLAGRKILEQTEQGITISTIQQHAKEVLDKTEILEYLAKIESMQLGDFSHKPVPPTKREIPKVSFGLGKLWLELTERCNLKCIHCYADASPRRQSGNLSPERWEALISEAADLGASWIQFIGGEPLLYGKVNLLRLISKARKAQFGYIEVFTNGSLLDDEFIDFFADNGVRVALSLYSRRPEIHDSVTQVPGSFQSVMKNVEKLHQRGVPFRVSMVVMKQNREYVEETLKWIRTSFEDSPICADIIRCTPGGRDHMMNLLTPDLWTQRVRAEPMFPKIPFETFIRNRIGHPCWSGGICINSYGKVFACIMERTLALGDVSQSPLSEIVTGEKVQRIWGLSKDHLEVCSLAIAVSEALSMSQPTLVIKDPCCLYDPFTGEWGEITEFIDTIMRKTID